MRTLRLREGIWLMPHRWPSEGVAAVPALDKHAQGPPAFR